MNRKEFIAGLASLVPGALWLPGTAEADVGDDAKYTANEVTQAGADFFGITTEAMAKAVEHVFGDLGEPDAYIKGDEGSGAFVVGLRYGSGYLVRKTREPRMVYWRGPRSASMSGATPPNALPSATTSATTNACSSVSPAWKAASISWRGWA